MSDDHRSQKSSGTISYDFVPGFFAHSESWNLQPEVAAILPRFGLIESSSGYWDVFKVKFAELINSAPPNVSYKLFLLGRHGQGFHNVAEAKYSTATWDEHWSKLDGDDELTWGPDAELTAIGEAQADEARVAWIKEIENGIPIPTLHFCSPMTRSIRTYELTFRDNVLPQPSPMPIILENCREQYGEHTCDKRRPLSYLLSTFPTFAVEPGFTEQDELWLPDERESHAHVASRAKKVIDRAFHWQDVGDRDSTTETTTETKLESGSEAGGEAGGGDGDGGGSEGGGGDHQVVSITAHSGFINGFLQAVGHPPYPLPTGGIIPVVVRRTVHADA